MLHLLTCARGHFWEAPEASGVTCPECGAPADALSSPDLAPVAPAVTAPVPTD